MGNFSDRLARLQPGLENVAHDGTAQVEVPAYTLRLPPQGSLAELRDWHLVPTPYGTAHIHREYIPYGDSDITTDLSNRLGDKRLVGFTPDNALYIDIEATGLSHGAGTLAFLIGCAYLENHGSQRRIVLEQLFVDTPENEMPVLAYFLKLLYRFDYLVSFNGKSYDLSVLQNRLVLTRLLSSQEREIKLRPHLDLLHSCRLAYVGAFENTKLQTLERMVLKLDPSEREDDVPGSLVPSLYFHFLRTGYASVLDVVLRHNRTDVLSMVSLTNHLMMLVEEPPCQLPPLVAYNLGRAALRFKQNHRALQFLERAVSDGPLPVDVYDKASQMLITAARRAGHYALAARLTEDSALALQQSDPHECARLLRLAERYRRKVPSVTRERTSVDIGGLNP